MADLLEQLFFKKEIATFHKPLIIDSDYTFPIVTSYGTSICASRMNGKKNVSFDNTLGCIATKSLIFR